MLCKIENIHKLHITDCLFGYNNVWQMICFSAGGVYVMRLRFTIDADIYKQLAFGNGKS